MEKLRFHYSSQTGVNILQPKMNTRIANARELLTLEKSVGVGVGATMSDQEIADFKDNTDWMDYFYKPSCITSHNLSVESGNEKLRSYTGVGYLKQEGTLLGTSLQDLHYVTILQEERE